MDDNQNQLMKASEIARYYNVSVSFVYRWIRLKGFPAPEILSKGNRYWRIQAVDEWLNNKKRRPDQKRPLEDIINHINSFPGELLTINQVMEATQLSVVALYKLRKNGTGPKWIKQGVHIFYDKQELIAWLKKEDEEITLNDVAKKFNVTGVWLSKKLETDDDAPKPKTTNAKVFDNNELTNWFYSKYYDFIRIKREGGLFTQVQISKEFTVTRSAVSLWVKQSSFPKPVYTEGKTKYWYLTDVEAWWNRRKKELEYGPEESEGLGTLTQIAEHLNIPAYTLYDLKKRYALFPEPTLAMGGKKYWKLEAVQKWLEHLKLNKRKNQPCISALNDPIPEV